MQIRVQIDTKALQQRTLRESKRLAYSTAQALNRTAKTVQLAEQANLDRKFTVRKHTFMYRLIKIKQWANVKAARPFVEIFVDSAKARVLLGIFEEGGEKQPAVGKEVAVPVTGGPARRSFAAGVAQDFTFRAMNLKQKRGANIWQGRQGTYEIPGVGVFQHIAGQLKGAWLYVFKRRPKLRKTLGFGEVAAKEFSAEFEKEFRRAYRS
jgi:hypothetical protein